MIINPLTIFALLLIVAFIIGFGAIKLAPKEPTSSQAKTSYAGGEDIPGSKRFPGYKVFFPIALFFTILHVLALLLGLLPVNASAFGLLYAGLICFSLIMIILR